MGGGIQVDDTRTMVDRLHKTRVDIVIHSIIIVENIIIRCRLGVNENDCFRKKSVCVNI